MKPFKNLTFFYPFLALSIVGCIAGLQTQTSPIDAVTATSGMVLSLSTSKSVHTVEDSIKLNLNIQNGQFNLLVPFADIATSGAFKQLRVKDTDSNIIEPEHSISVPIPEDIFIQKNGKSVQCIQGLELKAESTREVSLEDLQKYYALQKGSYTITLTMTLSVYRDSLEKRHLEVIELEEEIKRIQKVTDAHVSAADKRSAINDLQQQIASIKKNTRISISPSNRCSVRHQLHPTSLY